MHLMVLGITTMALGLAITLIGTSDKTCWIVRVQGKDEARFDPLRMRVLGTLSAILGACSLIMERWEPSLPGEWGVVLGIILSTLAFWAAHHASKRVR